MTEILKVTGLEWQGVRVPFKNPFVTAKGAAPARCSLLIFLHASTGIAGVGEAAMVEPETEEAGLESLGAQLREKASELIGTSLADIPSTALKLFGVDETGKALRFGIETAAYDVLGKTEGLPLAALLGGRPKPVPVNALIGAGTPEEMARRAAEAVSRGFKTVKIKLTGSLEDVERVAAVRKAVGEQARIRADVNQGWTLREALESLRLLEPFRLEYVEQPLGAEDFSGMARLRRAVKLPIGADEAVSDLASARRVLDENAADLLVVKAARVGGLLESTSIMRLAKERGVPSVVTSSLETGIGTVASLHLASAGMIDNFASGLATTALLEHDLLLEPLAPIDGLLPTPDQPGLGVSIDEARLRRYSTGLHHSVGG